MWTRRCALPHKPIGLGSLVKKLLLKFFRRVIIWIAAGCLLTFLATSANAEDQIIAAISLNQQPQGDYFVILLDNGDFQVRVDDLESMGLENITGTPVERGGGIYLPLGSINDLNYQFNENTLTIEIMAAPRLLPSTSVDLAPTRRDEVYYPHDNSMFLNYSFNYEAAGDSLDFARFTFSNEVGIRYRDILFLSDGLYTETPNETDFIRLNTSFTFDQRESKRRFIGGDFFASTGILGSQVNMGGLSFSKIYRINPYFISYPLFNFNGQLPLPSEVDLYLDGVKLKTERFNPGEFTLDNFQSTGGAQTIDIVIRDSLGREEHITSPFYFTDQMLRRGLHEYSYNLGVLRENFGSESNDYNDLAFAAFHRYGLTDRFNFGLRGEAAEKLYNFGLESIFKLGSFGLMRLGTAASSKDKKNGWASLIIYEFQARKLRVYSGLQNFSEKYATLSNKSSTNSKHPKLNLRLGASYTTRQTGTFRVDYAQMENYENLDNEEVTSLSWSKRFWRSIYVDTVLRQRRKDTTTTELWVNLTRYFKNDHSVTARYRHEEEADIQRLEARKTIPTGEGIGWEIGAEHSTEKNQSYLIDTLVQHNARHAILRGRYSQDFSTAGTEDRLNLAFSGSLVHLGGTTALSRPVRDSFGLITVGDIKDVRLRVNGQTIGQTNKHGQAVIPDLSSYYENRISFEDKDIPIDYLMPQIGLTISPPLRSGSCINFPLKRYQAFSGKLKVSSGAENVPLENVELIFQAPGGPITFWTAQDGEFYLDSQMDSFDILSVQSCETTMNTSTALIPAGSYSLEGQYAGQRFQTNINIPESDEAYTELGEIILPLQIDPELQTVPPPKVEISPSS